MYQLEFGREFSGTPLPIHHEKGIDRAGISALLDLNWEEHCVECAAPECYGKCPLYIARKDGACARFVNGISKDYRMNGHYNFGAEVLFRKWGKLEANLHEAHRVLTGPDYWQHTALISQANKSAGSAASQTGDLFDEFLLECYTDSSSSYRLILEYFTEVDGFRKTHFRHFLLMEPGYNLYRIPFYLFNMVTITGYVHVYPEKIEDFERVVFTWLDFIKYAEALEKKSPVTPPKIKCVVWDLDQTLWSGILAENTSVEISEASVDLVKALDAKGIIQCVISKNHHETAMARLKEAGLADYFIYTRINWEPKSKNLGEIAEYLNIGLDTFAVIDDSAFERNEIQYAFPQVRVYPETEIGQIISYSEFDVPVSVNSKNRRLSYLTEISRNDSKQNFSGSYVEFLIGCEMRLEVFQVVEYEDEQRCWELVQRSNQLNLSSKRYPPEIFRDIVTDRSNLALGLKCKDKFGDYGIVGFARIHMGEDPLMEDFVLSCRVAQKRVEHGFFQGLISYFRKMGYRRMNIHLVPTPKNLPLRKVFEDLPFESAGIFGEISRLTLDLTKQISIPQTVILDFLVDGLKQTNH